MSHRSLSVSTERRRLEELEALLKQTRRAGCSGRGLLAQVFATAGIGDWKRAPRHVREAAFACRTCPDPEIREAYRRLLLHVEACAGRLLHRSTPDGYGTYLLPLRHLAERHAEWIAEPERWRPHGRSAAAQFEHLARFLLRDQSETLAVRSYEERLRLCAAQLAPRHAGYWRELPLPLTRKAMYHLLLLSERGEILRAMRTAQVLAMGGSLSTAGAVARTTLGDHLWDAADEQWWAGVLRWMVQRRLTEPTSITVVVEYLHHRRYGDGPLQPPDPAFALPGRSLRVVLALAEAWQKSQVQPAPDEAAFPRSTLVPGCWEIHGETWTVTQIRDSAALRQEGEAMRHCVATYARSAKRGICTFWSMRRRDHRRAVTLRVDHESLITERRGHCNRALKEIEREVLRRWADLNGLGIRT